MGKLTGDNKYFDFAIRRWKVLTATCTTDHRPVLSLLFTTKRIPMAFSALGTRNGWLAVAQAELLTTFLPTTPNG